MGRSLDTWIARAAAAEPGRLALRSAGVDLTYAELEAEVERAAAALAGEGVGPGSLVALNEPPGPAFVVRLHAAWRLGAVAVPRQRRAAGEVPAQGRTEPTTGATGVACRLFTSGTAAEPRPVELTFDNFLASARGSASALASDPADRWLCCLPLNHVAGLSILTRAAIGSVGVVLHDGFEVERVAAAMARDDVTLVSLVATQLGRLLDAGVDISGPRAIIVGGGPVPRERIQQALEGRAALIQSYGMTETCSQVTLLEPGEARRKAGSAGRPLAGAEVEIDAGEIVVRGPMVAPGALGRDGWLHTGDLGRFDEEGYLWVEGRSGDVIVTGGENVMPEPVEAALRSHPDVLDAAVVGRPDPEWQEAVSAIVVRRSGARADADALRAHCASLLARHEVPKRVEFTDALPRTASGKLQRSRLR